MLSKYHSNGAEYFIFTKITLENDNASIQQYAVCGDKSWILSTTNDNIKPPSRRQQNLVAYIDQLTTSLQNEDILKYEYNLSEDSDTNELIFAIKESSDFSNLKTILYRQHLKFQVDFSATVIYILNLCYIMSLQQSSHIKELNRLSEDKKTIIQTLSNDVAKTINVKDEIHNNLLRNFSILLNSKKCKILELQDSLKAALEEIEANTSAVKLQKLSKPRTNKRSRAVAVEEDDEEERGNSTDTSTRNLNEVCNNFDRENRSEEENVIIRRPNALIRKGSRASPLVVRIQESFINEAALSSLTYSTELHTESAIPHETSSTRAAYAVKQPIHAKGMNSWLADDSDSDADMLSNGNSSTSMAYGKSNQLPLQSSSSSSQISTEIVAAYSQPTQSQTTPKDTNNISGPSYASARQRRWGQSTLDDTDSE